MKLFTNLLIVLVLHATWISPSLLSSLLAPASIKGSAADKQIQHTLSQKNQDVRIAFSPLEFREEWAESYEFDELLKYINNIQNKIKELFTEKWIESELYQQLMKLNPHIALSENDFDKTKPIKIKFHNFGACKWVFVVDGELKNHNHVNAAIVYKHEIRSGSIDIEEINYHKMMAELLTKLKNKGIEFDEIGKMPIFGKVFKVQDNGNTGYSYFEQYINGPEAQYLEKHGVFTEKLRRQCVTLLFLSLFGLGEMPNDIHFRNFLVMKNKVGEDESYFVDAGVKRVMGRENLSILEESLLALYSYFRFSGEKWQKGNTSFIFDAMIEVFEKLPDDLKSEKFRTLDILQVISNLTEFIIVDSVNPYDIVTDGTVPSSLLADFLYFLDYLEKQEFADRIGYNKAKADILKKTIEDNFASVKKRIDDRIRMFNQRIADMGRASDRSIQNSQ